MRLQLATFLACMASATALRAQQPPTALTPDRVHIDSLGPGKVFTYTLGVEGNRGSAAAEA